MNYKILVTLLLLFCWSIFSFGQSQPNPPRNQNSLLSLKPNASLGKDAFVWSNAPINRNYGNASSINVYTWTNGGLLGVKRAYLLFDLSTLPASAVIDSSFLNLFFDPSTNEGFFVHSGSTYMEVKRVTSPWSEATITWSNQPSATAVNKVIIPPHANSRQNYSTNVTALINDMRGRGNSNYGFQIKMFNELNYYRGVLLASSDHSDSTLHPELNVYYHISTDISEEQNSLANAISVYPNPTDGIINLSANTDLSSFRIDLLDILGKEVQLLPSQSKLDLGNHPSGIYFLKITDRSGSTQVKKIILR